MADEREVVVPEVLPVVPRSGMVPFVHAPEQQSWTPVKCSYCACHGVTAFHDVRNCDEDYGDRWTG